MKTTHSFRRNLFAYSVAAVLGSVAVVSVASPQDESVFRTESGIRYISGGVGDESMARLDAMAGEFNLKLVFAMKNGEYLSEVQVGVLNAAGKSVLDTTAQGPWLLTKLPVGRYQVSANFAGKTETHPVVVGETKLKTVDFRWASE